MHHISVTWHFRRCKLFFFWIPSVRRTICCHFHENRCYFIFSTLYNLNIYLWPLKPHNFKSMYRISKIITFLESLRQTGWFDLFESDIQALLIFDPLITLWGNFDAPYLKLLNDASVASACFYVRTCRRVRNSKKIATIRDFHLPGSFLCLSTRLKWPQEYLFPSEYDQNAIKSTDCHCTVNYTKPCCGWIRRWITTKFGDIHQPMPSNRKLVLHFAVHLPFQLVPGGGHWPRKGVWVCAAVMTPFFQASRCSLAYQFTINVPLMCPHFQHLEKICIFSLVFGQNFSSQEANISEFSLQRP